MSSYKRVVVTGMGAVTPIGNTVQEFWQNAVQGVSGAGPIQSLDAGPFKTQFACELKDFDAAAHLSRDEIRRSDRFTQLALVAAAEAMENSGLNLETLDPFDIGVIWGSGQGGMLTFEEEVGKNALKPERPRYTPFFIPKILGNLAGGLISMKYGLMGISYSAVSACATGNSAIMDALNYIRLGKAKVMVAGGSEAPVSLAALGGFGAMKALSCRNDSPETASRPFDRDRDGFVLGEGAGVLILEELEHALARGAEIYAELAGAAMTSDAYHISAPHPDGLGAARCMQLALQDADVSPEEVNYLNAHGTSTPVGDVAECRAIARAFGDECGNLVISSTKSMTGHLLGAAGAVEAIACIKSVQDNIIPPTINTMVLDEDLPQQLNILTGSSLHQTVNTAISNSFGFGGHNATLVFKKYDE